MFNKHEASFTIKDITSGEIVRVYIAEPYRSYEVQIELENADELTEDELNDKVLELLQNNEYEHEYEHIWECD